MLLCRVCYVSVHIYVFDLIRFYVVVMQYIYIYIYMNVCTISVTKPYIAFLVNELSLYLYRELHISVWTPDEIPQPEYAVI